MIGMGRRLTRARLAGALIGALATVSPAATTVWQHNPAEAGNWFDPLNWSAGMPVFPNPALIDNGGTALLASGAAASAGGLTIGDIGGGAVVQSDGNVSYGAVFMANQPGSFASFTLSGAASSAEGGTLRVGSGGSAIVQQTGGSLSFYESYMGSGLANGGTYIQSGGTASISNQMLFTSGTYELSGSAQLTTDRMWMGDHTANLGPTALAQFNQTGGTFTPHFLVIGQFNGRGAYNMSGGTLTAAHLDLALASTSMATFTQSGGLFRPGYWRIGPTASYTLTGGTLQFTSSLALNQGAVNFNTGSYTIDVHVGIADLTRTNFNDVAGCVFTSAPGTLTLLPAGFDTSRFAHYTPAGLVHKIGAPLTIPAGSSVSGVATIPDFVTVAGNLTVAAPAEVIRPAIHLPEGIHLMPTGAADVGAGVITIENSSSRVEGGLLKGSTMYVGKTADATFTQTAGEITRSSYAADNMTVFIGYNAGVVGTVTLSGTGILRSAELNVGFNGTGHFIHNGGQVTGVNSSGAYIAVHNSASTYTLSSGSISTANIFVTNGTFNQSGGAVSLIGEIQLGQGPGSGGTYDQSGGTLSPRTLVVGNNSSTNPLFLLRDSGAIINSPTVRVGSQGGGTYRQTGGTATLGAVRVGGANGNALLDMQGGTLTASTLTIAGPSPAQAVYDQSSGNVSIATDAFVGHNGSGGGGTLNIRGGQFTASRNTIVGGFKLSGSDPAGGDGALNISGGSATFGTLLVGDEAVPGFGSLTISSALTLVTVKTALQIGGRTIVQAVPGATIHMTGSAFSNHATDPANLSSLAMMTLVFEGGSVITDPFEVAGQNRGASASGFDLNFALGTLQIGGANVGKLRLVDLFDNQPAFSEAEALYVSNLLLGPGSTLELNGRRLYYYSASIDPAATVTRNGGELIQIPEPAGMAGLILAACALRRAAGRRRLRLAAGDGGVRGASVDAN